MNPKQLILTLALTISTLFSFGQELKSSSENDKWGYKDEIGDDVIKAKYYFAYKFLEGIARVELNNKYGFINTIGEEVIPIKYNKVIEFSSYNPDKMGVVMRFILIDRVIG